jgi:hypothetical protein
MQLHYLFSSLYNIAKLKIIKKVITVKTVANPKKITNKILSFSVLHYIKYNNQLYNINKCKCK